MEPIIALYSLGLADQSSGFQSKADQTTGSKRMTTSTNNTLNVHNVNELDCKRVLVTGGTQGIGKAIAERLTHAGATVITTARSTQTDLQTPDLFIQADVSTAEGAAKIVQETPARLGGVDVLVNVVGGSSSPPGGVLALSDEDWQLDLNQNVFSAVGLDRRLLPTMLAQGSGVINHGSSIPLPQSLKENIA